MSWDEESDALRNGYARWEQAETRGSAPRLADPLVVPVFVRLRTTSPGDPGNAAEVRAQVIRGVIAQTTQALAQYELDYLQAELSADPPGEHEIRTVVFRAPGNEEDDLWEVLHVGPPIVLASPKANSAPETPLQSPDGQQRSAIVGVIDDAIGYLNARFRTAHDGTRIRGVWLQSSEKLVMDGTADGTTVVHSGRKIGGAQLEELIRTGGTESAIYMAQNDRDFPVGSHKSTNRRVGHGTHVLDIAAGADPDAEDEAPLILAVQLPPAAVGETSGRRLDPFIVMGLRWVVLRALEVVQQPSNDLRGLPLIVNISLGSLAGPKDGTSFLEDWLRDAMNLFERLSNGQEIRIVAAYGNARRARLVGRLPLAPGKDGAFDWRILPDDRTPSFLELRVPRGPENARLHRMELTLQPPGDAEPLILKSLPDAGAGLLWRDPVSGGLIAAVYAEREPNNDTLLICVAPTARDAPGALAAPGAWRLTLQNSNDANIEVSLQVQRDDTPDGFRRKGRQSWLDHEAAWTWDDETMNYMRPAPDCPVTREGSEVSFSGLCDPRVFFVGAATFANRSDRRPSRYSSEGSQEAGRSPTLAAMGDEGCVLTGLSRAGVLSGTTARLSGTSMAAPQLVRALVAQCALGRKMDKAPVGRQQDPEKLVKNLRLKRVKGGVQPVSRLGAGILPAPPR